MNYIYRFSTCLWLKNLMLSKEKQFVAHIINVNLFIYLFIYLAVLGFEPRAYTLSHSTSPFFCDGFFF
jgi:hypothetical protein